MTIFDQTDGLQGDQFLSNACFRSASGELYFGGQDGLTYFFPDSIKSHKFIPPVVITDFKLFNKSEILQEVKLFNKFLPGNCQFF